MSYPDELVKEYFPDAAEHCLKCPGLEAAAISLRNKFGMASTADLQALEAEADSPLRENLGPERFLPVLAHEFTNNAAQSLTETTKIARQLTDACNIGATAVTVRLKRRGNVVITKCNSMNPIACFIPQIEIPKN